MYNLIKQYVNKLTIYDIKNYCIKKNIIINDNETNIIYTTIKTKWEDLYKGNTIEVFNNLEKKLSKNTFKILKETYIYYKNKINF